MRGLNGALLPALCRSSLLIHPLSNHLLADLQNIHIAHIVIDGLIDSAAARKHLGLSDSEYFPADAVVDPREAAKAYLFLAQQAPSAWTFEMDLRPAREHF